MEEIPAPLPLIQKKYSLEPDMIFGWKPKIPKSSPIPLDFSLNPLPSCKEIPDQKLPVIYHGYRPQNSHIMHKYFSTKSTYNYLVKSQISVDIEYNYKHPVISSLGRYNGMKKEFTDEIEFDSFFECGNLDKAVKSGKNEYDLYMRSDTNTYGYYKWFYFRMLNKSEDRVVKLNICNYKEQHSLFNQGQKPMIRFNNQNWEEFQGPVVYKSSKLNRVVKKGNYYQLTLEVNMKSMDFCYLATTVPYTVSELHQFLDGLPGIVEIGSIGKTLSGVTIPLITITGKTSKYPKKYIVMQARTHPSETVGSVLMQNCVQYLLSNENAATKLLNRYIFKIIPMVNIDGVVIGNSRMSFAGDDLNRKFAEPDSMLHPEVIGIKALVDKCNNESGVLMFLDIHGHSKKKGSFMYGPYFPLHSNTYFNIRLLPKYLSKKTDIFRYYSCRFKSEKSMRQSARLVMSQDLHIKYTYTMENSLFGYVDNERNSHSFKPEHFKDLAKKLLESIYKFSKAVDLRTQQKDVKNKNNETNLHEIIEENKELYSSSESDSQSESEEDCLEAKKNVVNAIKRFRKARKDTSTSKQKNKTRSNKRIRSQNHLSVNKNLPDLNKKFPSPQKNNGNLEKLAVKTIAQQSPSNENKTLSFNDTASKVELSNCSNIESQSEKSIQRLNFSVQKTNYSKINLFEMFTNRKGQLIVNSQNRFKKNLNFPAFCARPMKN